VHLRQPGQDLLAGLLVAVQIDRRLQANLEVAASMRSC